MRACQDEPGDDISFTRYDDLGITRYDECRGVLLPAPGTKNYSRVVVRRMGN